MNRSEMAADDIYKTIKSVSGGIYKEKGSKFLASAWPVSQEYEIKSILEDSRKKHHEAKHHCYAYIIGQGGETWRSNDDGEPTGTAGRPILGQIKSYGLTNVLIVVSRYFGGTLLGVSGLINAYKTAAASALANAEIIDHIVHDYYEVIYPYSAMNAVMTIIKEEDIKQSEHSFDLLCRIVLSFRSSSREKILNRLSRVEGLTKKYLSSV
jgi:uncharacterized YigZ family protein